MKAAVIVCAMAFMLLLHGSTQVRASDSSRLQTLAQDDAQRRIDEKLKALEPKPPQGCESKMAVKTMNGFALRCDTLIPFGALLGAIPVSQTARNLEDCVERCRRVPKCVAFSYDAGASPGNHSCYLSGSMTEYRNAPNWISGTR